MTEDEKSLLLTVARSLRAAFKRGAEDGDKEAADFLWGINEALKPFDPLPGEPINEAALG